VTYSCSDFTDDIVSALKIDTDALGEEGCEVQPSELADAALKEIQRLQSLKFFHAEYASRHFAFDAYGRTETSAIEALRSGLAEHARQYRLASDWYSADEITVQEIELGVAYRDHEKIRRA
jgi:hypothetical protein